jgi:hypothetical protein
VHSRAFGGREEGFEVLIGRWDMLSPGIGTLKASGSTSSPTPIHEAYIG